MVLIRLRGQFQTYQMDNGLKLIHYPRKSGIVVIGIGFYAGLINEDIDNAGISHFVEHILFTGTKNRSRTEISEGIENVGGILNAMTFSFGTCYYASIPKNYFQRGAKIISDMVINPAFTDEDIRKEKTVIINEIRGDLDSASDFSYNETRKKMFQTKILRVSPAGDVNSVKNLDKHDLLEYYGRYYNARNAFVIVIGLDDAELVKSVIQANFQGLKRGEKNILPNFDEKPLKRPFQKVIHRDWKQGYLSMSYKTVGRLDDDSFVLDVISAIYDRGLSGRLIEAVRHEKGLAYSVGASNESNFDHGLFNFHVITRNQDVEECQAIILREIKNFSNMEITEVENAKQSLIGNITLQHENPMSIFVELFICEVFGDLGLFNTYAERIASVSIDEVKRVHQKYFKNPIIIRLQNTMTSQQEQEPTKPEIAVPASNTIKILNLKWF